MKKNILNLTLASLLALSFSACNEADFLSKTNPNTPTDEGFWDYPQNVDQALCTIYAPIRNQSEGYYGAHTHYLTMTSRGDDVFLIPNEDGDIKFYSTFTNTANMDPGIWGDLYKGIQRANMVISNLQSGEIEWEQPELKQQYLSEAYGMRGMYYFLLASNYGAVPLHLEPVVNPEDTYIASSPEETVWKQVEDDFIEAAKYLPVERAASERQRISKGMALAYLGKTYVFQKKYAEAKEVLGQLLQSPYNYDLVEDPLENFHKDNKFNKESVYEIDYVNELGGTGTWGGDDANASMGMNLPTYLGPEGTGARFKMAPASEALREFIKEPRPEGSDSKFDKRMYATFYFNQNEVGDNKPYDNPYDKTFAELWETPSKGKLNRDPEHSYMTNPKADNGVQFLALGKKYTNFFGGDNDAMYTPSNRSNSLRVFRFAEVLLLHAEACAMTNDLAGANADLQRIRNRAGLAPKDFSAMSQDAVMKEIEHQNFLEFCMEGHRFYQLKRYYTAAEIKQHFIDCGKVGGENFAEKYFYYPISEGERNNNPKIEQNPLWK